MVITITTQQITAFVVGMATFATAISVIYRLWFHRWVVHFRNLTHRAELFWDDWAGVDDRPGVPGRPGMLVRMAGNESQTAALRAEMNEIRVQLTTHNGGSTVRDSLRATQSDVAALRAEMGRWVDLIAQRPVQAPVGAITARERTE